MTNYALVAHWNLLSSLDPFYILLFQNLLSSNRTGRLVRSLVFLATLITICRLLLYTYFVLKALLCYLEQHLCHRRDPPMASPMHLHLSINTSPLMHLLPPCAPSLWLLSDAHALPLALNASLSREDFDPIFIAALLSGETERTLWRLSSIRAAPLQSALIDQTSSLTTKLSKVIASKSKQQEGQRL
jgi:hypothetical protein